MCKAAQTLLGLCQKFHPQELPAFYHLGGRKGMCRYLKLCSVREIVKFVISAVEYLQHTTHGSAAAIPHELMAPGLIVLLTVFYETLS